MEPIDANFRLTFLYVDKYAFSDKWNFMESVTPYCMYRYVLSGSADFVINGQRYRVGKDDVFYIPNGCTLECHAIEQFEFISVRFVASLELRGTNLLNELYGIPLLNPMMGDVVKGYFEQLYLSAISKSRTKKFRIDAYLGLITAALAERASGSVPRLPEAAQTPQTFDLEAIQRRAQRSSVRQDPRITVVVDYLVTHPQETFTTKQLCDLAQMSESTLRRLFKAQTGKAPVDFIKEMRMMNAARRLIKSDERISDIAYGMGYDTPNYFTRCFRETFGISPQEYRKRSRQL